MSNKDSLYNRVFNVRKNIKDTWNGEHTLVYSFWILYVIYISVLAGILFYFIEMLDESSISGYLFSIIFLVFIYIYSIIASVGVLRSAEKYITIKKKNNSSSLWGKLAQLVVVLGFINSIIELFKLVRNF